MRRDSSTFSGSPARPARWRPWAAGVLGTIFGVWEITRGVIDSSNANSLFHSDIWPWASVTMGSLVFAGGAVEIARALERGTRTTNEGR